MGEPVPRCPLRSRHKGAEQENAFATVRVAVFHRDLDPPVRTSVGQGGQTPPDRMEAHTGDDGWEAPVGGH